MISRLELSDCITSVAAANGLLNPAENQNSWSREERKALLELLVTCIRHYCAARQLAFDDDEVKYDLGKFLMRTGKFSCTPSTTTRQPVCGLWYDHFWSAY